jgi:hypothetical protein
MFWLFEKAKTFRTEKTFRSCSKNGASVTSPFLCGRGYRRATAKSEKSLFLRIFLTPLRTPDQASREVGMLHQVIFSKLLGEIDYGALGDFDPSGFV